MYKTLYVWKFYKEYAILVQKDKKGKNKGDGYGDDVVVTGNFAFLGKHQSVQERGLMVRSDTGGKKNTYILILFVLWS